MGHDGGALHDEPGHILGASSRQRAPRGQWEPAVGQPRCLPLSHQTGSPQVGTPCEAAFSAPPCSAQPLAQPRAHHRWSAWSARFLGSKGEGRLPTASTIPTRTPAKVLGTPATAPKAPKSDASRVSAWPVPWQEPGLEEPHPGTFACLPTPSSHSPHRNRAG